MYKVLLADDEKTILEGISTLVDWEKAGATVTGKASDGKMAYEMILQTPPDIVISDVKMPGMNGLELIEKVKQRYPDISFIILSGYDEFEFAKRAMQFNVKHYLLKPCNEKKIMGVLQEVVTELEEKKRKEQFVQNMRYNLEKVKPQVKEQFLKEFITNNAYGKREWEYYNNLLGINISGQTFRLILFEIEGGYDFEHIFALRNIATEIIEKKQEILLSTTIGERVVILVKDQPLDELLDQLKQTKDIYHKYYKLDVTIGVSEADDIERIRVLYKETKECLNYRFYLGKGSIITTRDWKTDRAGEQDFQIDHENLALNVKSGRVDKVEAYLDAFFDRLKRAKLEVNLVKSYSVELYMTIIRQASKDKMDDLLKEIIKLESFDRMDRIKSFIMEKAKEVTQTVYESNIRTQSRIVKNVLRYVEEHLDDETLSLTNIAKHVFYMNTDYLGKLFKKETGKKFSTFVMEARIQRAVELIEHSDVKVFEIANKVGFGNNPQYFSQVFKKHTGYTPSEYKKLKG